MGFGDYCSSLMLGSAATMPVQNDPAKPVRIVTGFAPGRSTDVLAQEGCLKNPTLQRVRASTDTQNPCGMRLNCTNSKRAMIFGSHHEGGC